MAGVCIWSSERWDKMTISDQRKIDLQKAIEVYMRKLKRNNPNINGGEYGLYYRFTNEPFVNFVNRVNVSANIDVLTVLASGDQAFNFIQSGANHIDTFDINRLTEYFALGFKKTAIQVLNYENFLKLFNYNSLKPQNTPDLELEKSIIESCPEEYKWFWQEFTHILKDNNLNPSVFEISEGFHSNIVKKHRCNNYMNNEENYKLLQKRLLETTITFQPLDLADVSKAIKQKYDYVFISNILDAFATHTTNNIPNSLKVALKMFLDIYRHNVKRNGELTFSTFDFGGLGDEFIDMYNLLDNKNGEKVMYPGEVPLIFGLRKSKKKIK